MLIEPSVLRAAQQIYSNYAYIHPVRCQYVTGVSVHRETYKGFVNFRPEPIILPNETFVPIDHLVTYPTNQ